MKHLPEEKLPPHVFRVGLSAFQAMVNDKSAQAAWHDTIFCRTNLKCPSPRGWVYMLFRCQMRLTLQSSSVHSR